MSLNNMNLPFRLHFGLWILPAAIVIISISWTSGESRDAHNPGPQEEEPDVELDEITMEVVRQGLFRFHESNILVLEMDCFILDCPFARAKQILSDLARATEYWNHLNCVKYGKTCPRSGKWSEWGEYEACSARCGDGYKVRWRDCSSPYPMYGGLTCAGPDHELAPCYGNEGWKCAFDPSLPGYWSPWSPWSHCEGTRTERGFRTRSRRCQPSFDYRECEAFPEQRLACRRAEVDVDGRWSHWGWWSECTTKYTCGDGVRIRKRSCSNPHVSGAGADCLGPSSESKSCSGQECETEAPKLAHFLTESYLSYRAIAPSHYLNIHLKFLPNSDGGLLFQYTTHGALQEATKSGSVKIKKQKIHQFVNYQQKEDSVIEAKVGQDREVSEDEDYVFANLEASDINVHIKLNGSEKIAILLNGVKNSQWNELRISIVSNMIWVRLNDGENIEARLEDYLENEIKNGTKLVSAYISKLTDTIKSLFNPSVRQIFAHFNGEVGLGAVRRGFEGFRGYVSHFAVNHRPYTLRLKPKSEISKLWDPFRGNRIKHASGRLAQLSLLTHFNGRQAVELPLTVSWVKVLPASVPFGRTPGESATFEFIIMPECEDALFFFIRSKENPFTHWKLSIDERRTVRLAMSDGGEITLLKSGADLHPGRWNKVILQLVRSGPAHLQVNGKSYYKMIPNAAGEHRHQPIAYVGGYGKAIAHDVLLGKNPTPEVQKEFKSFVGYIYSVRQNDFLHLIQDLPQVNTFHMLSSTFVAKTNLASTILFFPTSADKEEPENHEDYLDWEEHSEYRALLCNIPTLEGVRHRANVSWYRNDMKIVESDIHWTNVFISENSHVAALFFGKSVDSSQDHSGVYQCVVSYFSGSFVAKTFVAAVIPEDIAHYGSGGLGWIFRGYSMESAILMLAGAAIGTIISLLMIVACIRKVIEMVGEWKKSKAEEAKENIPLRKISKKSVHSTSATSYDSYSSYSEPRKRASKIPFSRLASNVQKSQAFQKKSKTPTSSSGTESPSPKSSFVKVANASKRVKQFSKKIGRKSVKGESAPLLQSDVSDSDYEERIVTKMGSLVKVKQRKKIRTEFKDNAAGF